MVFRNFLGIFFAPSNPHLVGNSDLLGVCPVLGCRHLEKFRARANNIKTQFPGARGTFGKKFSRPKGFSPSLRNFFALSVLADRTPTGGELQNTGVLGPFWPRTALGTERNSGPKTEKAQFPRARRTLGEKIRSPPKNIPKMAQFFLI